MEKTVAIIGAGPVGLAAAAHVMERGMTPIVLEAGSEAGHSVRQWQHVQLFSPWEYNVDKAAARLLAPMGWNSPDPGVYPTGAELLDRYIEPLATNTALHDVIRTNSRVSAVGRAGFDKAKTKGREAAPSRSVPERQGSGDAASRRGHRCLGHVEIAKSGWRRRAARDRRARSPARIAYGMPDVLGRDRKRYAGKTVAVRGRRAFGYRDSDGSDRPGAAGVRHATGLAAQRRQSGEGLRRRSQRQAGRPGRTRCPFRFARRGRPGPGRGRLSGRRGLRGRRPAKDPDIVRMLRAQRRRRRTDRSDRLPSGPLVPEQIRLRLDPAIDAPVALAPLIDPNEHSCGTVRPHGARELAQDDPGFYIAGIKSYGRAPTFLMITGYEQVRSIVADIDGDKEAAARVELELPETGVCTRAGVEGGGSSVGCCGGPASAAVDACWPTLRRRLPERLDAGVLEVLGGQG